MQVTRSDDRRVAPKKEIIGRGSAAEAFVRSLWSVEKEAAKRLALTNELTAECRSRDQTIAEFWAVDGLMYSHREIYPLAVARLLSQYGASIKTARVWP